MFRRSVPPAALRPAFALLLLLLALLRLAAAQETGGIQGTLLDGWDGKPLAGVTVLLRGTTLATTSDAQGRFLLQGVTPGEHTVRFSRSGYAAVAVTGIRVIAGQVTTANGTLRPEFYELEEYEVTAEEFESGAVALLLERQSAVGLLDAIGSEQFRRLGVSDAADIMTKVTGTTVVDGKFAVIRGLGDRYNITLLNGAEVPTADPYRRAAQLDLIPAAMIESVVVSKTFTPDLPGGFAGGAANIITRSFPEKFTLSVSLSLEYNDQATFNDGFLTYPGSGTDWAGFDDGRRALPEGLKNVTGADLAAPPRVTSTTPANAARRQAQADQVQALLNSFEDYTFAPSTKTAPPNHGGSLSIGDTFDLGSHPFGYFANVGYSRKYSFYDDGFNQRFRNVRVDPDPFEFYRDARSITEVQWSAVINLAYRIHEDHELGFNFIYNQSAEDVARRQVGARPENLFDLVVDRSVLQWIERHLENYQMRGDHGFPDAADMHFKWLVSVARTTQDEPDQRLFNYARDEDFTGNIINNNALPEPSVPTRNYRDIEERNLNVRADHSIPFSPWNDLTGEFKVGFWLTQSRRDFAQKSFGFDIANPVPEFPRTDPWRLYGEPNTFFNGTNTYYIPYRRGTATNFFFPRQFLTTQFGNYSSDGSQDITAGYFSVDLPFSPWLRVAGGLRPENTDLSIISRGSAQGGANISQLDLLPSLSTTLTVASNMNVRFAYSSTVARPTYRELDPVQQYDPFNDEIVRGNPNLTMTDIDNYDLRWEWFPRPGAVFSVGGFKKSLTAPIEKEIVTFGGGIVTFVNVPTADLYGVEAEARTKLDFFHEALEQWSFGVNYSWIQSEVPLSPAEVINDPLETNPRPLYDQSPWVLNADVTWEHKSWGTTATLAFNQAGERLYLVDRGGPDVYEHPPPVLDLIISQKLSDHWRLRFTAKNLLNPEYRRTYGSGYDDPLYSVRTAGRVFGIVVTYDF